METAGVVESVRSGRETLFSLRGDSLTEAAGWLEARADAWDQTLDRLKKHLE
ncbi:MAG: hypothetical protein U9N56_02185 [Actinomycetota bacterium]|nr:hypothetical protein [Actinomycetota bacterium]